MEIFSSLDLMFSMRIGFSKDIHRTKAGVPLVLGGVKIPNEFGLESHSDGDCVTHAIVESILGALALGGLGKFFPPSDDKYKNISSIYFLNEVKNILKKNHHKIGNIDVFISCEKPKLSPYIEEMVKTVSQALEIEANRLSIKAGTNEKIGEVGRCEAIEAYSVCLLEEDL